MEITGIEIEKKESLSSKVKGKAKEFYSEHKTGIVSAGAFLLAATSFVAGALAGKHIESAAEWVRAAFSADEAAPFDEEGTGEE